MSLELGKKAQGQTVCPSRPQHRHCLAFDRSAHLPCTAEKVSDRLPATYVKPIAGIRTIDKDGLERGIDRVWTLSIIERLQICHVCKLAEVPRDPYLVLVRRDRLISGRVIQVL